MSTTINPASGVDRELLRRVQLRSVENDTATLEVIKVINQVVEHYKEAMLEMNADGAERYRCAAQGMRFVTKLLTPPKVHGEPATNHYIDRN